jgi:gamma-glutamyltranspeptidase/glutathione hydrolase
MLRAGGNAVDAAVATAFAVSVGEPQMSGVGGGGSMLIWLQREGQVEYLDFYAATRPESFRDLGTLDSSVPNLRIVGIPGAVAGLLEAHQRYGRLSRAEVMAPAIRLAEDGFPVNQVLAQMIARDSAKLARFPESSRIFWPEGKPLQPGAVLRNPALAFTLRRIADEGRDGFYTGETARRLVEELNRGGHPATLADLADYRPQWKRPLCGSYRKWTVLSAPPPQTGIQVIHTLMLLEPYDLRALGLPTQSAEAFGVLTSALRVGMTGPRHNSDPNWATVPAVGVISRGFAHERAGLVGARTVPDSIETGRDPLRFDETPPSPACQVLEPYGSARQVAAGGERGMVGEAYLPPEDGETTHLSVVDAEGNAVALTQTNSSLFGSGAQVAGFFLNDSGIDYSRSDREIPAGDAQWQVRTSTIAPTLVVERGRVKMVVGAPGGGRIPTAIVQTMVYALDYGLDPLNAVRMPRIFPTPTRRTVQLENGFDPDVLRQVREFGYEPAALSFGYARLYMIVREGNRWIGVADPRHDGGVRGY